MHDSSSSGLVGGARVISRRDLLAGLVSATFLLLDEDPPGPGLLVSKHSPVMTRFSNIIRLSLVAK